MKKWFLLYSLFFWIAGLSQGLPGGVPSQSYNGKWQKFGQYVSVDSGLFLSLRDTGWTPMRAGVLTYWRTGTDSAFWEFTGQRWRKISGGGGVSSFNGDRPITRDFDLVTGVNLKAFTTEEALTELLYPNQLPVASLSGGVQLELMATGAALPYNLNYSAGRLATTSPLATITVAGTSKSFSQPSQGGSVTGTHAVSVTRNVTTVYNNVVATTDNKSATASTSFSFLPKRYSGWVNSTTPTDAEIKAIFSEFATSKVKVWIQNAPTGDQNLAFAYPASMGVLASIVVNGFPSIEAFEIIQRPFVNASGYSQTYNIYVSTNKFSVTGTTTVSTQ